MREHDRRHSRRSAERPRIAAAISGCRSTERRSSGESSPGFSRCDLGHAFAVVARVRIVRAERCSQAGQGLDRVSTLGVLLQGPGPGSLRALLVNEYAGHDADHPEDREGTAFGRIQRLPGQDKSDVRGKGRRHRRAGKHTTPQAVPQRCGNDRRQIEGHQADMHRVEEMSAPRERHVAQGEPRHGC
jgi:hypothetical protein